MTEPRQDVLIDVVMAITAVVASMTQPTPAPVGERLREHELKTWPEYYAQIVSGEKTFELRKDDRGFRAGDVLRLREWRRLNMDGEGVYTGRESRFRITYVLSGFGLQPGFVVLGIRAERD